MLNQIKKGRVVKYSSHAVEVIAIQHDGVEYRILDIPYQLKFKAGLQQFLEGASFIGSDISDVPMLRFVPEAQKVFDETMAKLKG